VRKCLDKAEDAPARIEYRQVVGSRRAVDWFGYRSSPGTSGGARFAVLLQDDQDQILSATATN
jgi:hypothetical protein